MTEDTVTIYYQADCNFCNACRRFVEIRDFRQRFVFRDIKESGQTLQNSNLTESIIVVDRGEVYIKFSACLIVGKQLKNPWPYICVVLRIIPKSIGNWGYDWAANHRNFLMKFSKGK